MNAVWRQKRETAVLRVYNCREKIWNTNMPEGVL